MTHNMPIDDIGNPSSLPPRAYKARALRICYLCGNPIGAHDKYVHVNVLEDNGSRGIRTKHRDCKHPTEYPSGTKTIRRITWIYN